MLYADFHSPLIFPHNQSSSSSRRWIEVRNDHQGLLNLPTVDEGRRDDLKTRLWNLAIAWP